jgi:hypothetical protein
MRRTAIESVYAIKLRKCHYGSLLKKSAPQPLLIKGKMKLAARVGVRVIVVNKIFESIADFLFTDIFNLACL